MIQLAYLALAFTCQKPIKKHKKHWDIKPPQKHPPPSFLPSPLLNLQNVHPPHFIQSPLYIVFFPTPYEGLTFQGTSIILKFFISNPIPSLKVTKFLVKIFQLKFLVMTEKNIFVYIIFFVVKYFGF